MNISLPRQCAVIGGLKIRYIHDVLKSLPGKKSMRVRRKRAGWDDEFLASALAAEFP
jgi:hypothetical protein